MIGHAKYSGSAVLQLKILIFKRVFVDTPAPSSVFLSVVPSLWMASIISMVFNGVNMVFNGVNMVFSGVNIVFSDVQNHY